MYELMVNNVIT